jgi:hypothetical protein
MAKNTLTSHITIHIMKVLGGSPMRIHDVEDKSVINYPHHECAEFIANRFHEENSRALPTS